MINFDSTKTYAEGLDNEDKLSKYKNEFNFPISTGSNLPLVYLCGHSLGLQPKRSVAAVHEALTSWNQYGVKGHLEGDWPWLPYHEFITDYLAQLVGAKSDEVVCMNSLTANLHFMMVSFYRPTKAKYKILIEQSAFPSDDYAVQSQAHYHGFDPKDAIIRLAPRDGEYSLRTEDILKSIEKYSGELALILLPGVQYYTGQVLDIETITEIAHKNNIIAGFDLAHAAGNIELKLHDWNVDFACWCHYKYLNSGPGAVGGCFINQRHARNATLPRFAGWWGHDKQSRFSMPWKFQPMKTVEAWQLSNPPIMSLASIRGSLSLFIEAGGMSVLQKKSQSLSSYLINLLL